ncbi:hypothetical protein SCLCIDRAFT_29355 [Scleroderma citrinum Foug A]|uniref:Uncharacterized protein n=1 Tax=Scleroderma citrinum Foug A TaxID=1036808 RepID=A0A0C3DKU8_9AGAM|nr:hypothetical protein SCLCIDRAFT_29355 [Scleroderma citrinum Foug A]
MSDLEADLVDIQVGGGGRPDATAPLVLTPTHLCTSIKATDRDGGLISKAQIRCTHQTALSTSITKKSNKSLERKQFLGEPEIECVSDLFQSTDDALEVDFLQTPSRKNSALKGHQRPRVRSLSHFGVEARLPLFQSLVWLRSRLRLEEPRESLPEVNGMSTPSSERPNEESNVPFVDNPSSTQLELTLHSDAKLVSDMLRPELATSTVTSDGGAAVMPPEKSKHACSYCPVNRGLASSAALDRLGFEPSQLLEAPPSDNEADVILLGQSKYTPSSRAANPGAPSAALDALDFELAQAAQPLEAFALPPSEDSPVDLDESEDNQFAIGRPSDAILDIVQEGLDHITTYLTDLVVRSGQPPQQLIDRFVKQYTHLNSANDWNKYSKYFAQNTQAELNRFWKTGAQAGSVDTKSVTVRRQCYELFKKDYPETWQKILTKFKESVQYTEAGKMFAALLKSHGIEAAFIMAGSIVNQDASLGYSYTMPGAEDFFMERCCSDSDAIISHFKAHIYNRLSLACVTDSFNQDKSDIKGKGKECSDVGPDVVDLTLDSGNHTPDHANDEREDHKLVKKLLTSQIESHGHTWASGKLFPWKQLLQKLGQHALVCMHWPDAVLFPGQERASCSKPKGVSDLTILESAQVIAALRDTGPYRLHFKSMLNKKMDLLGSKIPVIHGAPPLSDSDSLRGKRVFFNGKVDYEGPARLPNTAKTRIRKQVLRVHRSTRVGWTSLPVSE